MSLPAFALATTPQPRLRGLAMAGEASAASAVGTLVAVTAAVLAAHAGSAAGIELAVGVGIAATVAAPALAMILHGLQARRAARTVVGGLLLAPAAAVYYLFEDPRWLVGDELLAAALAATAALMALCAWRLERRLGLWAWWLAALPAIAGLWAVGLTMMPAVVWLELP